MVFEKQYQMEEVIKLDVLRMDHLGILAGTAQDLGVAQMIDERIPPDSQEFITTGEPVVGLLLNGRAFIPTLINLVPE